MNQLYYGDNLKILREHIKDGSVDLIYLDPPFKSDQNYNVIFKEKNGRKSTAQMQAFEDTWHWCRNCSNWPISDYGEKESNLRPTTGELCDQCLAKEKVDDCSR